MISMPAPFPGWGTCPGRGLCRGHLCSCPWPTAATTSPAPCLLWCPHFALGGWGGTASEWRRDVGPLASRGLGWSGPTGQLCRNSSSPGSGGPAVRLPLCLPPLCRDLVHGQGMPSGSGASALLLSIPAPGGRIRFHSFPQRQWSATASGSDMLRTSPPAHPTATAHWKPSLLKSGPLSVSRCTCSQHPSSQPPHATCHRALQATAWAAARTHLKASCVHGTPCGAPAPLTP